MEPITPALSGSDLQGIVDVIQTNFSAAIPYGLAIMGIFLGFSVLKRVLYSFM